MFGERAISDAKRECRIAISLMLLIPALGLAACGGQRPAPPVSALPIASSARLVASRAGGDAVDPASDPSQFRYEAVSGASTMNKRELLLSELTTLKHAGWRDMALFRVDPCDGALVVHGISPRTLGANVLINSPRRTIYAALSTTAAQGDADDQTDGTPLWGDRGLRSAIEHREPVLLITLGNGTHGPNWGSGPAYHSTAPSRASAKG